MKAFGYASAFNRLHESQTAVCHKQPSKRTFKEHMKIWKQTSVIKWVLCIKFILHSKLHFAFVDYLKEKKTAIPEKLYIVKQSAHFSQCMSCAMKQLPFSFTSTIKPYANLYTCSNGFVCVCVTDSMKNMVVYCAHNFHHICRKKTMFRTVKESWSIGESIFFSHPYCWQTCRRSLGGLEYLVMKYNLC